LNALYALFSAHASNPLNTAFETLPLSAIVASPPAQKLALDARQLD